MWVNALEKSIYISGGTAYLAPEQLNEHEGVSTRSATVDSFGFGMTLYFLIKGTDPAFGAHAQPKWRDHVTTVCTALKCKEWDSLPRRISRLIIAATLNDQNSRLTFGQIVSELERLWRTIQFPTDVSDISLVAEECFARVATFSSYELTQKGTCYYLSPCGVAFEIDPHSHEDSVLIKFSFVQAGHEKYQILDKIGNEFKGIKERLARHFEVLSFTCNLGHGDFHTDVVISYASSDHFVSKLSKSLEEISTILINIASAY